ncbi:cell adhesion molecule DSCAML1-like [Panonychus citri]|uniref:cell adhesion molecule DSCAML1-like n=1 Tax=Panonychus citri TaxID=50023 RepID=UPI00230700D4|nr:cell adhesion molecule DSCAML1-like [Panonychus citri]
MGSLPLHFNWFRDGKEIKDLPTIKIRNSEELSTLLIDSINSAHSGNYTCKISNRYGQDSYSTELLIEGPPNWIDKPSNVKTKLFQPIILRCAASGYPKPKTEWKKLESSEWINVSPNNQITVKDESLEIIKSTRGNTGRFGCLITNKIKPDLWAEFDISVEGKLMLSISNYYSNA